jgi:hypothetical protein
LEDDAYRHAGMVLAYSIVHGGTKPAFFSELAYQCIVHGLDMPTPSLSDVADPDLRLKIKEVTF